jgi:hypothetical protein
MELAGEERNLCSLFPITNFLNTINYPFYHHVFNAANAVDSGGIACIGRKEVNLEEPSVAL